MAFQKICLFCYKSYSLNSFKAGHRNRNNKDSQNQRGQENGELTTVKRFLISLERFVLENVSDKGKVTSLSAKTPGYTQCLGCCENCDTILVTFSSTYHQLKVLQLQLEWKLQTLVNVMRLANRVPSRVALLKQSFQNEENELPQSFKAFKHFRSGLVKTCARRLSRSQPKVLLKRVKLEPTESCGSASTGQVLNVRPKYNTNVFHFLGWITSVSAVLMLAITDFTSTLSQAPCLNNREDLDKMKLIISRPEERFVDSDIDSNSHLGLDDSENHCLPTEQKQNSSSRPDDICILNENFINDASLQEENSAFDFKCDSTKSAFPFPDESLSTGQANENTTCEARGKVLQSYNEVPLISEFRPENCLTKTKDAVLQVQITKNQQICNNDLLVTGNNQMNLKSCHGDSVVYRKEDKDHHDMILSAENLPLEENDISNLAEVDWCTADADAGLLSVEIENENLNEVTTTKRYNLRGNRKRALPIVESEEDEEDNDSCNSNCYNSEESSSSSDDDSTDVKSQHKGNLVLQSVFKKRKSESKEPTCEEIIEKPDTQAYHCRDDGCSRQFNEKKLYERHQILHKPSKQKCHFCDVVQDNVILISIHENEAHPNPEQEVLNEGFIFCPRCHYKTKLLGLYQMHFAESHIEGCKKLLEKTNEQISSGYGSKYKKIIKCQVCQKKITKWTEKKHFQGHHGIEEMDPNQILECSVDGCEAYFKTLRQVRIHEKKNHKIKTNWLKESDSEFLGKWNCTKDGCSLQFYNKLHYSEHEKLHAPGEYKCNFCDVVEENLIKLSLHEKATHLQKSREVASDKGKVKNIQCPRCPVKTKTVLGYQWHFAHAHYKLFEKSQSKFVELIRCETCNTEIGRYQQKLHRQTEPAHEGIINTAKREKKTFTNKIICGIRNCKQMYAFGKDMAAHKKLHGTFKCQFCKVVKEYAPELALHEREHAKTFRNKGAKNSKVFYCARCPSYYFQKSLYVGHYIKEHFNLSAKKHTHICPICKVQLVKRSKSQHHLTFHNTDGLDPSQILKCDLCPAYFLTSIQLALHKTKFHFKGKCPECSKFIGSNTQRVLQHLDSQHQHVDHFPSFVFRCNIYDCRKRYGTEAELEHHKKHEVHSDNSLIKCSKCHLKLKGEARLRAHLKTAHPPNPFICSQCGKSFRYYSGLLVHQEYHKGPEEWKFDCPTCGKKCISKQKLEEHKRTHSSEKKFCCQFCGEKYAHSHNLRNHIKKHKDKVGETEMTKVKRVGNYVSRKGSKKGDCIVTGKNVNLDKNVV